MVTLNQRPPVSRAVRVFVRADGGPGRVLRFEAGPGGFTVTFVDPTEPCPEKARCDTRADARRAWKRWQDRLFADGFRRLR